MIFSQMGIFREENQILNFGAWETKKMIFPVCFSQIMSVCTSNFLGEGGVEEKRTSR